MYFYNIIYEFTFVYSLCFKEYNKGSLWKYHLIAGCWEEIKCKNLPKHFKFNSILLLGNLVFLHGGNGPKYSNNSICQTFIGKYYLYFNSICQTFID